MRLKQIKLAGFKSFVDPTTVTLPGNRCAVVGPNGCGKSNIIDAVRWVMGESSAKQLRGENLTDVIFNGSNTRKPTAVANIELIFDNSDGRIGGEYAAYADIAIRRQVTRDSQSNYYLNGNKCRRRDIQDVFLGTGFGPRSYSIIEQGMISQMVDAKPEELRVYLEEAAGISKYKERRRETENRIRHTRENLERINDIREELGRTIDRLQRQAQAAERYRELRTEESLTTAQLHVLRYDTMHGELAEREERIRKLEIDQEKAIAEQRELEASIEQSRQTHAQTSDQFNEVQGEFYQVGADIARIEETIQFNQQRVNQLELDLRTVNQRAGETTRQLSMDEGQITELQARVDALLPEVEALSSADTQAADVLAEQEQQARSLQQRWDEFNAEAAANDREAEVQASRIEHLDQLLQRLRGRQQQLQQISAAQTESGDSTQMDVLAEQITALEGESRGFEIQIDECLTGLGSAREDVLLRERVLEEARGDVQTMRHELASLQAVQDAALGEHEKQAVDWIDAHELGASPRLAESLAVVAGWERAVEAVLGHFLRALQVDDLSHFAPSLAELPDGQLALVEIGGQADDEPQSEFDLPSLDSLVRTGAGQAVSLLRGVFAADSTAVALAKRGELSIGQSIITRQGFWVGPDWVRVLHDHDEEAGILERAQALETLGVRVEEAETTLAQLTEDVSQGRARIEALETQREELQQAVNSLKENLGQRRTDHGVTQVRVEEADARREQIQQELSDLDEQVAQEAEKLSTAREALQVAEQARDGQSGARDEIVAQREQTDTALTGAREQARASRDKYHALNLEQQGLASRLASSRTARDRLLAQQTELAEQETKLADGISNSSVPLPELQEELAGKLANRVDVEKLLGDIRGSMESAEQSTRSLDSERAKREALVNEIRTGLENERVERQGLAVQEANILEQLGGTGHELEVVRKDMPEEANESSWSEQLDRIGRRIQRLGAINLAAIDEYEQESERKSYLDAQAEDLDQAMETLLNAIHTIDKETRTRFKTTFDSVNKSLGELFPKVFGGGHAYLELTGEDLLDTGVSLMARPPGKRNASVQLLSGGEKAMTAVALIFSIFRLNPSPVCLLDEVDAPLDDANVSRFAGLIEEMSAEVQFLVITHNKITMEMADYLMGVTMQEPGVSRLVSVDVDEAAAMAV